MSRGRIAGARGLTAAAAAALMPAEEAVIERRNAGPQRSAARKAPLVRKPRAPGSISERDVAPEDVFLTRRALLAAAAGVVVGSWAAIGGGAEARGRREGRRRRRGKAEARRDAGRPPGPLDTVAPGSPNLDLYPARRNDRYTLDRPLTDETVAATSNNFYEFSTTKGAVWRLTEKFQPRPWTLEVAGLVERPKTHDVDALARRMGLEERLYRLRCVEAWSIAVPWTGFPLATLLAEARPLSSARFVRFVGFSDAAAAPGQRDTYFPWPYYEALRIDEATSELTMLATGIYGHELPKQHGAPIRLVVPWKYGFKSIKSIRRIELVAEQPRTFWSDVVPEEYGFLANVRPDVEHSRWPQATETLLGSGEVRPTLPYNGYVAQVAHMYEYEGRRS